MTFPDRYLGLPAPAKLNLFLHVVGRRADGYHLLQSVFQLIDLADEIDLVARNDGQVRRVSGVTAVAPDDDLTVRAARALQRHCGLRDQGVDIAVRKRIPIGGGLGGGSSDAATTLIGLNRLWRLGLSRVTLQTIALELGADVPFFVFGQNAWVQGVGEQLQAIHLPSQAYAVVFPGVSVPTKLVFDEVELTRNTPTVKLPGCLQNASQSSRQCLLMFGLAGVDWLADSSVDSRFRNDLQPVVQKRIAVVDQTLRWLNQVGAAERMVARMSGSGSCCFLPLSNDGLLIKSTPPELSVWTVRSLQHHPLIDWLPDAVN